jgi:hypothetical protein
MELMQANRQWASRPQDERFESLITMQDHFHDVRNLSRQFNVQTRNLEFRPVDGDASLKGLVVGNRGGNGVPATNWAFGQIAKLAKLPDGPAPSPSYLASLPAPIAADCLNYGLRFGQAQEAGMLLNMDSDGKPVALRAATSTSYGRIWNSDVVDSLVDLFGDGISGSWRVPGEFGKEVAVTKENTTLFASDRDFFVFLADEKNRIDVPNRRAGRSGSMARGFFVWNSEVGAATFGIKGFLFDYVCCNRIVWGAEEIATIRIRHTAKAPTRWLDDVKPVIDAYAESSSGTIQNAIAAAQTKKVDDVKSFLENRFSKKATVAIMDSHMSEEQRPMETLWDVTTGITAYAKSIPFNNERVEVETIAGKVMQLAA